MSADLRFMLSGITSFSTHFSPLAQAGLVVASLGLECLAEQARAECLTKNTGTRPHLFILSKIFPVIRPILQMNPYMGVATAGIASATFHYLHSPLDHAFHGIVKIVNTVAIYQLLGPLFGPVAGAVGVLVVGSLSLYNMKLAWNNSGKVKKSPPTLPQQKSGSFLPPQNMNWSGLTERVQRWETGVTLYGYDHQVPAELTGDLTTWFSQNNTGNVEAEKVPVKVKALFFLLKECNEWSDRNKRMFVWDEIGKEDYFISAKDAGSPETLSLCNKIQVSAVEIERMNGIRDSYYKP